MLRRLSHIAGAFQTASDRLESFDASGDRHRLGKAVLVVCFASGKKIVYKPRSLSIDKHFQQLLEWINARLDSSPLKILRVIDRGNYGWVEYVHAEECITPEQAHRFFKRQGRLLALLYILGASDIHFENLIAAGEHPVIVDLESLFQPRLKREKSTRASSLAAEALERSVLQVGVLPERIWLKDGFAGVDVSALGAAEPQVAPDTVLDPVDVGSDKMRLERKAAVLPSGLNIPKLNGERVDVLQHIDLIVTGFSECYENLAQHTSELLSEEGLIQAFSKDEVRVVLRPTRSYAKLLFESYHPDFLRDALDREHHFDRLWLNTNYNPHLKKIYVFEIEDLHNGDIPIFTTTPSERSLRSSLGAVVNEFFEQSGLEVVAERINTLSQKDLEQQVQFIRSSLATLTPRGDIAFHIPEQRTTTRPDKPLLLVSNLPERLVNSAQAIGERLEAMAFRGTTDANWLGWIQAGEAHARLSVLEANLYDGVAGIALFLAQLGNLTRQQKFSELAKAATETLQVAVRERGENLLSSLGAFGGWSGLCYAFLHLGKLWNSSELVAQAVDLVKLIGNKIDEDDTLDVIGGSAGCIGALLALHHITKASIVLETALSCGERLIARASTTPFGVTWATSNYWAQQPLGFAHGSAGIIWSLANLAAVSGREHFTEVCKQGLAHERATLFLEENGGIIGLRSEPRVEFSPSWCHGAVGIGLSRLGSLHVFNDPLILSEINLMIDVTLESGFAINHSLCHGGLGNLEFLQHAGKHLNRPNLVEKSLQLCELIVNEAERSGWVYGTPFGVETPGLMLGLSGIGYGLLRLAHPNHVPSVLLLAPPCT